MGDDGIGSHFAVGVYVKPLALAHWGARCMVPRLHFGLV